MSASKIFGAKVAGGVPAGQALAQTGAELLALQSLVNSLPSFRDGTENTGNGGSIDSHGGFHAILHPNEMVIPSAGRDLIPHGMSTMEVAMAARESRMQEAQKPDHATDVLAKKLDSIERAIKQQPVLTDRIFDADRQAVVSTTKRGTALLRKHKSLGLNG